MADKYSNIRYNKAPTVNHPRTRFNLSHDILVTCNTGDFVPTLVEFINPGETVDLKTTTLSRLETSLHQTMDNAYVEEAFFAVPLRILWTDFEKFEGSNDDAWAQTQSFSIPQINLTGSSSSASIRPGSLLNYLMLPAGSYGSGRTHKYLSVEMLSLRATYEVFNQWYRDENYDSIIYYSKTSGDRDISNLGVLFNGSYFLPYDATLKVHRLRDRFSTVLPAPQKGQEVSLGLAGFAPVVVDNNELHDMGGSIRFPIGEGVENPVAVGYSPSLGLYTGQGSAPSLGAVANESNLVTDLTRATSITINQLRLAIVRQAMLERDARTGTRSFEIIQGRWNTTAPDLVLDRCEYLGGKRTPVSMMEVLQTSETGTTVLGSDAGHSKTFDSDEGFIKSFSQHCILLGFLYFRTDRSYSQGIDRRHFIKDYLDLPDPMLDKIGEVPVYRKELYAIDTSSDTNVDVANEVFGYQEQYYWLKERPNRFCGYFQPGINGTLDSWHYGDSYISAPLASASWMKETADQVDRTIAVSSNAAFQWSVNIHFELRITRPFAKYSIPNTFGF